MLLKLIGVPQVSPLRFRQFAETYGIQYLHLSSVSTISEVLAVRYKTKKFNKRVVATESPRVFTYFKIIYCSSAPAYSAAAQKISSSSDMYLVFVSDNPAILAENGVFMLNIKQISDTFTFHSEPVSDLDLLGCLIKPEDIGGENPSQIVLKNEVATRTIQDIVDASALHLVQPLFYRIKDQQERSFVQNAVFLYLSGTIKQIGRAGDYGPIVEVLSDPKMQRLRQACLYAKEHGIDNATKKFGVDKFEISYLFSRIGLET